MIDRSDLRAAVLSTADDWRADPSSWAAGTDPLKALLTIKEQEGVDAFDGMAVFMAIGRYIGGGTRDTLVDELRSLIPDGPDVTPR